MKKTIKKIICGLFLSSMLSGCLSTTNIKPTENFSLAPDEGVVVIGTTGVGELTILDGGLLGDSFVSDDNERGFSGSPESGYYVRKLKALEGNRVYGIVRIRHDDLVLTSCGEGSKIFAFKIKPGHAIYFGNVNINFGQTKPRDGVISRSRSDNFDKMATINITQDFETANNYFTSTYTNINLPLEQGELMPFRQEKCPYGFY